MESNRLLFRALLLPAKASLINSLSTRKATRLLQPSRKLNVFFCSLLDLDMKKDIDTFIAEERAEILSKYDRVRPLLV